TSTTWATAAARSRAGSAASTSSRISRRRWGRRGAASSGSRSAGGGGSGASRVPEVDRYAERARASPRPVTMVSVRHNPVRPEEHRQILEKVEAAWREGLRLHPQGTCSPLTSTFTITNGFVFGRD